MAKRTVVRKNSVPKTPSDTKIEIYSQFLEHAEYEQPIELRLDSTTMRAAKTIRAALRISRRVPRCEQPSDIRDKDPFVLFFTEQLDENDDPLYEMEEAKEAAFDAYQNEKESIESQAIMLALLKGQRFTGQMPDPSILGWDELKEENEENNMPTAMPRTILGHPTERRLLYIEALSSKEADATFSERLKEAIDNAVEKAKELGQDLASDEEEETDENGFQPESVDGNLAGTPDADGKKARGSKAGAAGSAVQ